jgi:Sigma-70 region 2
VSIATKDILSARQRSPGHEMSQRADGPSDEQLVTNLDGPRVEAVLSELYDRYGRTVFGVGLKILGDRSMAEELVQEVFLKVWRSSGTFDSARSSFSSWLYRVTRSVALDLYRKRAQRVRPVSDGYPHGWVSSIRLGWLPSLRQRKGSVFRSSRGRRRILAVVAGVESTKDVRCVAPRGDTPSVGKGRSQRNNRLKCVSSRGFA